MTRVLGGGLFLVVEVSRVRIEMLNSGFDWRALRTEGPRFPVACMGG